MTRLLLDKSGRRVIGACDEGLPIFDDRPFNVLGRRPWKPRPVVAAADIEIEIDEAGPTMMDVLGPAYRRLK